MEVSQVTETVNWCIRAEILHVKMVQKIEFPLLMEI